MIAIKCQIISFCVINKREIFPYNFNGLHTNFRQYTVKSTVSSLHLTHRVRENKCIKHTLPSVPGSIPCSVFSGITSSLLFLLPHFLYTVVHIILLSNTFVFQQFHFMIHLHEYKLFIQ